MMELNEDQEERMKQVNTFLLNPNSTREEILGFYGEMGVKITIRWVSKNGVFSWMQILAYFGRWLIIFN